jgi:hypothetical protein
LRIVKRRREKSATEKNIVLGEISNSPEGGRKAAESGKRRGTIKIRKREGVKQHVAGR